MRQRHQRNRGAGSTVGPSRNNEHRDRRHRDNGDLELGAVLIPGGALLQTGVLVDGLAAIAVVFGLRKGHGWRMRRLEAGLCHANRLGEKHPYREKAADCTTNSGTAKDHQSLTSTGFLPHCRPGTGALSSRLEWPFLVGLIESPIY
jgi:hypothetical protein